MAIIRGSANAISKELKKILKDIHEDLKEEGLLKEVEEAFNKMDTLKEMRTGVDMGLFDKGPLQAAMAMQQQQLNQNQLQNMFGNIGLGGLGGVSSAGQLSGLMLAQQQIANKPLSAGDMYPGRIIAHPEPELHYVNPFSNKIDEIAVEFGFERDFASGGYKSKYDGFVSRMDVEGYELGHVRKVFQAKKAPNTAWLDKRVDEMRVKLI